MSNFHNPVFHSKIKQSYDSPKHDQHLCPMCSSFLLCGYRLFIETNEVAYKAGEHWISAKGNGHRAPDRVSRPAPGGEFMALSSTTDRSHHTLISPWRRASVGIQKASMCHIGDKVELHVLGKFNSHHCPLE